MTEKELKDAQKHMSLFDAVIVEAICALPPEARRDFVKKCVISSDDPERPRKLEIPESVNIQKRIDDEL